MRFKKFQFLLTYFSCKNRRSPLILIFFIIILLNLGCNKEENITIFSTSKTFVVLGSSTAFGVGATSTDSSWVGLLAAKFIKDTKQVKVINLAGTFDTYRILPTNTPVATGKPSADTLKNITKALSLKPDFIIINLPSNDIAFNYTDDEILGNYRRIVSEITAVKVPYLITSTQPRNFPDIIQRKRLQSFNAKIETIYPENVEDYYNFLADSQYLIKTNLDSGDGIHLNNAGHKIVFEELFRNKLLLKMAGY